ncbi:MAG TPA: metallophosphoesterase [Gemmatimonadaceae bacterium]|nr:metallophosphoesterase [Gemmatimonadaceae bacterium]
MTRDITRRELLKAAGGLTFLALVPMGRGLFAAKTRRGSSVVYTALPYVQPGSGSAGGAGGENAVIAWQIEGPAAEFAVEYGPTGDYGTRADVSSQLRIGPEPPRAERRNYSARLSGLEQGRTYRYRIREGGARGVVIAAGYLTTRQRRGASIRFAAFGDNAFGDAGERAVAYHAYHARPDFIMNTGDNVYESGRDDEYARYFFPVYNARSADPRVGAPLLRSVPFYTVIANHDVHDYDASSRPLADFDAHPDSLAYFTSMHLPLNGPVSPPQATPIVGAQEHLATFRVCAGERYPRMANYSFDYGDAHFLCLDSNLYVDPTHPEWVRYIAADLSSTDARWKFVVYHHPAFNVGLNHYREQQMRVLSPLFEEHGVDVVLSGHEHNYQRTRPLRFTPGNRSLAGAAPGRDRRVPGSFVVDQRFDGHAVTKPSGVIYITTGAGGKELYDPGFTDRPERWLRPDDGNVAYVSRMVTDRHSFSLFEIGHGGLTMSQIDETGRTIDRIHVTKT